MGLGPGRPAVHVVIADRREAGQGSGATRSQAGTGAEPVQCDGDQPGPHVAFLGRVQPAGRAAAELLDQPADVERGDVGPQAAAGLCPGHQLIQLVHAPPGGAAHLGGGLDLPGQRGERPAAQLDALAAADPWDGLRGYIAACVELRSGALAALAGQIETSAEMRDTARRSMTRLDEIVARAQAAGHLRADVTALDVSWLIEQFSRRPPGRLAAAEERNVRSRLVAIALDGLRARPGLAPGRPGSLPGHPPRRDHYVNRWSPRS